MKTLVLTMDELGERLLKKVPESTRELLDREENEAVFGLSNRTGTVEVTVQRKDNGEVLARVEVMSLQDMIRVTAPLGLHKGGDPTDGVTFDVDDEGLSVYRHPKADVPASARTLADGTRLWKWDQ